MKRDYQTSTVDGAEGFEKYHNSEPIEDDSPSLWELVDEEDEECYDDYERCNCSDPGCPCDGRKRGGL